MIKLKKQLIRITRNIKNTSEKDEEKIMKQKKETKDSSRYQLYCEMIRQLDESCQLINDYDAIPHDYGTVTLYQAESQLIHLVGENPGITAMKLADILKKTPSACSQLIRKLRNKGWIEQVRSQQNGRKYQLYLTESGWDIFREHNEFEQACYRRSYKNLDAFTEEDFRTYIKIQSHLNKTFALDVAESKAL